MNNSNWAAAPISEASPLSPIPPAGPDIEEWVVVMPHRNAKRILFELVDPAKPIHYRDRLPKTPNLFRFPQAQIVNQTQEEAAKVLMNHHQVETESKEWYEMGKVGSFSLQTGGTVRQYSVYTCRVHKLFQDANSYKAFDKRTLQDRIAKRQISDPATIKACGFLQAEPIAIEDADEPDVTEDADEPIGGADPIEAETTEMP
ncbi:hypothetical protein BT63DRAFT_456136 [Microthyrium microscopicum]|uniref:Uncharacterized protein n=1 Tax=Microthyrium microscopicum TaxID=703497 RepID=A0A6A6UC40_9PEZI|nr:hypothetical protein BT63DRAFT_456136 [Microthyrium microscopicum]